jgi:hypothetical protein
MAPVRYCAYCDQPVEKIPTATKEWTARGETRGEFKHARTAKDGVPYCGRQFLTEDQTYLEGDSE